MRSSHGWPGSANPRRCVWVIPIVRCSPDAARSGRSLRRQSSSPARGGRRSKAVVAASLAPRSAPGSKPWSVAGGLSSMRGRSTVCATRTVPAPIAGGRNIEEVSAILGHSEGARLSVPMRTHMTQHTGVPPDATDLRPCTSAGEPQPFRRFPNCGSGPPSDRLASQPPISTCDSAFRSLGEARSRPRSASSLAAGLSYTTSRRTRSAGRQLCGFRIEIPGR
jgi:hypothetical protein